MEVKAKKRKEKKRKMKRLTFARLAVGRSAEEGVVSEERSGVERVWRVSERRTRTSGHGATVFLRRERPH